MKVSLAPDPELLGAALGYVEKGWRVLAVEPRGKRPLTLNGLKDATLNPETIKAWWKTWPTANVGLATGAASGFWVLDCDGQEGDQSLRALERIHGTLQTSVMSLTGGGGCHFLFRMPLDGDIRNSAGKILPGIDVRASGGYIVAPPSWHASGRKYAWEGESHPDDRPILDAPEWLLKLARTPGDRAPAAKVEGSIREGARNDTMASMAGSMRRRGFSESEILAALLEVNKRCSPPLSESEVRNISHSISLYAPDPDVVIEQLEAAPQEQPKDGETYPLLKISDILEAPPTDWVVDDWVPKGALVVLYGPPESAKSFVAISLMLAVATGRRWLGRIPVAQGRVLYCAGEGIGGMRGRLCAAAHQASCDLLAEAEASAQFLALVPKLTDGGDTLRYIRTIKAMEPKPSLVVVDTLSRGLVGAEENSAKDVGMAVSVLDAIRRISEGTVLAIHHSGKDVDRGLRGSSTLLGAADVVIAARREDVDGAIRCILTAEKVKDARKPPPLVLLLEEVQLGVDYKQRTLTSLKVREQSSSEASTVFDEIERAVLGVLQEGDLTMSEIVAATELKKSLVIRSLKALVKRRVVRLQGQKYVLIKEKE